MNSQTQAQSEDSSANPFDAASLARRGALRHHIRPQVAAAYVASGERLGGMLIGLFAGFADLHDRMRNMLRPAKRVVQ
jgi:hypothetical protein